ncbi:PREDICTED: sulfotransferase family cytosolic 1B member 1-like [Nicrophorus vespilloides]|uniref:Sulfotransferase family cytosolic 1B member 1-like n=1 Tax=Nicrophorus vespilloides TaxID=110193 RepID=A0ABM1MJ07_NICVS|nr:PREDICTED: sulfotransferase family cytosolic 1B member 1-like [Nicrophorus vespilloides]
MALALKRDSDLIRIRTKYFTNNYRKDYSVYNGFTMPEYFGKYFEEIQEMEVYDDDVWVTGFPKTGSTWTRETVWLIANDLDFDRADEGLPTRFPYLEFFCLYDFRRYPKDFKPYPPMTDSLDLVRKAKRPRFIKTHLPWDLLPKDIRNFKKKPKIIHIARNPKDTCVSYFHHCKLNEGFTGSFDDFWQLFVTGKLHYTPFWGNVLGYWNKRDSNNNILFLTYEEVKRDLIGFIKKTAKFLGKELRGEQIDLLVDRLSYESVKARKPEHFEPIVEFLKQFKMCQNESGHFFRAGLVGNYSTQMCADVIDIFDNWTEEHTRGTGLKFNLIRFVKRYSI